MVERIGQKLILVHCQDGYYGKIKIWIPPSKNMEQGLKYKYKMISSDYN